MWEAWAAISTEKNMHGYIFKTVAHVILHVTKRFMYESATNLLHEVYK